MINTQITVTDRNGVDGQVEVWYTQSVEPETFYTPSDDSIFVERWKIIECDDTEYYITDEQVEQALKNEIYK
jgi:hypothetical protein